MKKKIIYMVMACTLLLMAGCKDNDKEIDVLPSSQDGRGILIKETGAMQLQSEDFVDNMYDGMLVTDKPWDGLSTTALSVFHVVAKITSTMFGNFIAEQVPALDKQFKAETGSAVKEGRCWQIESYSFEYRSKSASGKDVVLSGRVTFPNNTIEGIGHKVKSLTLNMHHALPLVSLMPSQIIDLWTLRAFFNEAVIEPDGQGLGANLDKDCYCTVSSNVLARQMADCTQAALEVMRRHGVVLAENGYSICTSCSLGAAVPLSFAKYYETEASPWFRQAVRLNAVYTGCGPMDFEDCIYYFSNHPKFNAMLGKSIIFSLAALLPNQMYGYQGKHFVNKNLLNTHVKYGGRSMSYYEAEAKYFVNIMGTSENMPNPKKLSEILASDMLTPDGKLDDTSPKTQALLRVLKEQNNLSGWLPTTNIYMMHGAQDDGIPVEQSRKCYNALSNGGTLRNVHYKETSILPLFAELAKLPNAGIMHLVSTMFFVSTYLKEEPSKEFKN